jgi:hypothetical protein
MVSTGHGAPVRSLYGEPVGIARVCLGWASVQEATMNWKKIITWGLVIFALYVVFKRPDRAADLVNSGISFASDAARNVGRFFDALVA